MKHVVSVGGGISSTWLLLDRVIAKYGKENVYPVICEVANEHPDVWRLCDAVEKKYDIKIERIHGIVKKLPKFKEGAVRNFWISVFPMAAWYFLLATIPFIYWMEKAIDIWDIFFYEGMMGNPFADLCSRMLKREMMAAWMDENFDRADTVLHVRITADEVDRMLAIHANWTRQGWKVEADLADDKAIDREELISRCEKEFGFVPLLYRMNFKHNNCGGFCIKAGKAQMARLLYYDRKTYLYHETMELLHQQTFNHGNTIMRDEWTRKGVRGADPLTLRNFRLRMEGQWKNLLPGFDPFDGLEDAPECVFCASV